MITLTVADLDGDGHIDLVGVAEWWVKVIYGSPTGLDWGDPQYLPMHPDMGLPEFWDNVLPDLDGDGRRDIVCVGGGSELWPGALISWRLSTGPRQFQNYRIYTQGIAGYTFYQCDAGDVNRDGDSDLVCHSFWDIPDKLFLYDDVANTFLPSGNPFGGAWYWIRLAMLNDDEFLDAIAGDISKAYVRMGTAAGGFDLVQDLPGASHFDITNVLGSPGLDVVSVTWGAGPDIAVWENIVIPAAGLGEGTVSSGDLRVWPSVTGSVVHILSSRQVEQPISVDVFDPSGRILRTLPFSGAEGLWDGRDDSGRLVPSGVYWLKSGTEGGAVRVTIMR